MSTEPTSDTAIEIRQVAHPEAVRGFDTAALRRHFLIERLFAPGEVLDFPRAVETWVYDYSGGKPE